MQRLAIGLFLGFSTLVTSTSLVWAQATAQISGSVRDQTGAVLPGAEITAAQTDTGIVRNALSDETGSYILPNLATGPYRVEVAMPGFKTFVQTGIVLQVNSNPVISAVLEIGQVSEQVEVQANAAMVETRAVGVGQVIENERILELPLNGRQVTDLIVLAGAAVQVGTNNNRSMSGGVAMSVAGSTGQGVSYVLDGAMHTNPFNNMNLPLPFPDALQEFKVETSGLSAQNGMQSGASVNSVTKSGTNDFHANAFDFVRNDLFNARSYFATTNSTLKRNQFGGTIGGPIIRNKLFFFAGYQGTTVRQDPADLQSFIPTAAMLAGDFTAVASAACNAGTPRPLRAPFVNNRIDPAEFSRAALNIASRLPKTEDPCGLITYGRRNPEDQHQPVAKIDFQWSPNHSVFGRYMVTSVKNPAPYTLDPGNVLTTTLAGLDNLAQSFTLGDTYLIGSNMVNSFRIALNRTAVQRVGADFFSAPEMGIKTYSYLPKLMVLTMTGGGFALAGGTQSDATFRTTTYGLANDVSVVRGSHQMAFGVSAAHWRVNFNANVAAMGTFNFNGQQTGLALADFLTGKLNEFGQGAPNTIYMSQTYFGSYAQDSWRVTPRLTLNFGLRWEPHFAQTLRNGTVYNWSEERYRAGIKSTKYRNAPAGFYYPGDPGFPGSSCRSSGVCSGKGVNDHWWNLGPRIGLAWDPRGDGRMSVRASYGLAYEYVNGQFHSSTALAPPWGNEIRIPAPPGGFDDPWLGYPGGNIFPSVFDANAPFAPYGAFLSLPYDIKNTSSNSWNLSVQRQIGTDWLASASYMGRQTAHLWRPRANNEAVYIPGGPCELNGIVHPVCSTLNNRDARRRLSLENPAVGQYIGFLDIYDDGGTQSYHGLLLSGQRRSANGLTVSGNYTWSHCLGATNVGGSNFNPATNFLRSNDRDFDRGNCDGDRRHNLNLTTVAETPQFSNPTFRLLASGWRLSGIYRASSGEWLTITTGVDRALSGVLNQRPDQVRESPYDDRSGKPLSRLLNPAAFASPALGSYGNTRPGNVEGLGTWQFDTALSRIFTFRESQRLEFRAEAYNLTNSFRPVNPATALNSNTFGQIRSARETRIMQFALKYVF